MSMIDDNNPSTLTLPIAGKELVATRMVSSHGNYSTIYRSNDGAYAIKMPVVKSHGNTKYANDSIKREATYIKKINQAFEVGEHTEFKIAVCELLTDLGKLYALAMPFYEYSLGDVVDKKIKFDINVVYVFGLQIATALDIIHSAGIRHRDIKPDNIMLNKKDGEWTIKFIDYGTAVDRNDPTTFPDKDELMIGCSLRYIAPEVFEGSIGPKADIYAFGITFWEVLCKTRWYPLSGAVDDVRLQDVKREVVSNHSRPPVDTISKTITDKPQQEKIAGLLSDLWHPIKDQRPSLDAVMETFETLRFGR